ncbi:flagellar brake protein [Oleidesulfovibrio sp.]|uniref:flagellar brake protein n=1 Tax=Oleidesulfovibrio sp. TaxID=2909707 RepID=UPI003A8C6F27
MQAEAIPAQTKRNAGVSLSIGTGTRLLLNIKGIRDNLASELVGLYPYEFLILKMPLVPGIRSKLIPGEQLTVRYMQGGSIYGFSTVIVNHILKPASLVFVEYPKFVEQLDLRQHKRIDCLLPGRLHCRHGEYRCVMVDLSSGGGKVVLEIKSSDPVKGISPGDMLILQLSLYAGKGDISISCLLKNVSQDVSRMQLGLQFRDLGKEELLQIQEYLEQVSSFA